MDNSTYQVRYLYAYILKTQFSRTCVMTDVYLFFFVEQLQEMKERYFRGLKAKYVVAMIVQSKKKEQNA